jgi:iron complex outermembrane receptor protein
MLRASTLALLATSALLAPNASGFGLAWAQATATPETTGTAPQTQAGGLEKVVVTARKREEEAQAVPISITALSQADLDKLAVKTVEDLKYVSPSVYIAPTAFRQDTLNITIRGQRNFDAPSGGGNPGLGFDTATAVYKDGVYYARAIGLTGSLFDLDKVAVLKGPQGTLVGRNTTGGAILYTSRDPGPDFGGYVQATVGDYGRAGLQGAMNIPLAETLFLRVALNADNQKGYVANLFLDPTTNQRNSVPAFGSRKLAGVFSLKWQPSDSFDLVLRADLATEHDTGSTYHDLASFTGTVPSVGRASICNIPVSCNAVTDLRGQTIAPYFLTVSPTSASNVNPSPLAHNALLNSLARQQAAGFWSSDQAVTNAIKGHYGTYSATANQHWGDIDMRWMAAYRTFTNFGKAASRGQPLETNTYLYAYPNYQSWQSELTFNGKGFDNKLQWTAGLFYFNERSPNDGGQLYLFLPNSGAPAGVTGKQITITDWSHNSEQNSSYAGYAQATYSILPDTRFTAGVRYTIDHRYAHIGTQTVRTPATAATNAATVNGVFNPGGFTSFEGITYSGYTQSCGLTNPQGVILPLSQCAADLNRSFHQPTWTLALDHDLWEGTMVYATMRSGYRSGAINTQAVNPVVIVAQPEKVLDYEIGVKSDWSIGDIALRTNLALYQTVYHDIQVQQSLPNVTLATTISGVPCDQAQFNSGNCLSTFNDNVTLNARAAKIYGAEWDVTAILTDWLTLSAAGSYIDPRYTDFTFSPPPGYLLPTGTTNLSGTPIPVPAWQTNETATVNFGTDLGGLPLGDTVFTAHYYWQSRYLADMRAFNPMQRTFAYGLLNFRLEFTNLGHTNADLALFMNNVANTEACLPEYNGVLNSAPNGTFGVANTSGLLQCIPLPPRMTGVTLGYKF